MGIKTRLFLVAALATTTATALGAARARHRAELENDLWARANQALAQPTGH